MMVEKIASAFSTATVRGLTRGATSLLTRESGAIERAAELASGPLKARAGMLSLGKLAPEIAGNKPFKYTLKLPEGSGALAKVLHYGVQPAILGKNVVDVAHSAGELKKISPEKLVAAGLDPEDARKIYAKARGAVVGRAVGDAAAWALYPLSIRNPLLHYPIVAGGAMGAPRVGEYVGKELASVT